MKRIHLVLIGAAFLVAVVGIWLGVSKPDSASLGFVNSQKLMDQYVTRELQAPLQSEIDKLQTELDAQIAKTADLTGEERISAVEALKDDYQERLDERKAQLVEPLIEDVRDAISKVADEHRIDMVVDNVYEMVLYGGKDLTPLVLDELRS